MTFADKSRYDRTFQQVTHKGGESADLLRTLLPDNSLSIDTPKLVSFGHTPMETENVGHRIAGIVATIVVDPNRI